MSQITKKALARSLKTLMKSSSLDKITVKDVALDCGVNRQTFYYHFRDIYHLIEWIFTMEAVGSIEEYKSYDTWQTGFLIIFNYVKENLSFCTNCFNSMGRNILERFLFDMTFDLLIGVVNEVVQGRDVAEKDRKFIARFYSHAFIGIVSQWITEGARDNPEEIISDINRLIEGDIRRTIERKY